MAAPFRATQTFLFQPTQISGCSVWLDGADPNGTGTLPANGSVVSSWLDKSSNGMTVSAASSQPTYSRNVQNGLGALTFDGTKNLTTGNVLASKFAGNTINLSIFCVFSLSNTVTGTNYASPFCWANAGNVPRLCLSIENTVNGVMMDVGANVIGRTSFSVPPPTFDNTFYFISYFKNGVNTQMNLNGSNRATTNNQDTTQFGSSTYAFNVGNGYGNSAYFMRGNVGEILFYNNTLSTQNFQLIEGYLAWKWGLQAGLPATHPYKNTPVYSSQPFPLVPQVRYGTNSTLFLPTQIPGTYVWLDASTPNNFTFTSGSNISTWIDRSGNSYTATAANSPTYDGVNKRVRFANTSSQYMSNIAAPLNLTARSFFFVVEDVTYIPVGGYMPMIPNPTTGTDYTTTTGMTIENNNGFKFYANSGGYDNRIVGAAAPNAKGIYSEVFGSQSGTTYLNGTAGGTSNASYTPGTSVGYALGGRWNNGIGAPYIDAFYYEVVVYNSALSSTQRQQIEGYLAWKWNLQGSLPSTHPYKNTPVYTQQPFPLVPRIAAATNRYFNPTSIPGLSLWLDAADPSTVSLSGNSVIDVLDKSPSNINLSNASGFTYPNNTFNGTKPSFFVNGGGNSGAGTQRLGANALFALPTPFTVSFVCQHVGSANYGYILDSATGSGRPYIIDSGAGPSFQTSVGSGGLVTTSPLLTNIIFASSAIGYQNGTQQFTGSGTFTTGGIVVGNRFTLNESWPGHICEITIHNTALTTVQRQLMEGYMAWKWGLQGNLPATHPYKLFPPAPT